MEEEQHKCREREGSLKVMTSPSLTPPTLQMTLSKSENTMFFSGTAVVHMELT